MSFISDATYLFGEVRSLTKEEAFLNGYLMGMGAASYDEHNPPNFKAIAEDPELFISIEKDILRMRAIVNHKHIEEAKALLRKIYEESGRGIPTWLEKKQ